MRQSSPAKINFLCVLLISLPGCVLSVFLDPLGQVGTTIRKNNSGRIDDVRLTFTL